jgi:hypothetical protein
LVKFDLQKTTLGGGRERDREALAVGFENLMVQIKNFGVPKPFSQ